jgi:DNA-binding transcriptional MerR regulator
MSTQVPSLLTVGEIARRLDQSIHRIEYVIRSRGITPTGWAGNARVFTEADVALIASELRRIAADRTGEGLR